MLIHLIYLLLWKKLQSLVNFRQNDSWKSTESHTCWSVRHREFLWHSVLTGCTYALQLLLHCTADVTYCWCFNLIIDTASFVQLLQFIFLVRDVFAYLNWPIVCSCVPLRNYLHTHLRSKTLLSLSWLSLGGVVLVFVSEHLWLNEKKVKVKVRLLYSAAYTVEPEQCALQSWKWQFIGNIQWCCGAMRPIHCRS